MGVDQILVREARRVSSDRTVRPSSGFATGQFVARSAAAVAVVVLILAHVAGRHGPSGAST